ncbi:MAG: sugar ABC transporter substrate-binding protein [Clostridia bacterium]|nr:sugar ABC transporter substrate-binding protein [Clostridia bacterium]
MPRSLKQSLRLISLALIVAVSTVLVGGCGGSKPSAGSGSQGGSQNKKPVIGLSISTLSFPWQKFLTDTSVKEIEKMGGEAIVLDAQGKVDKQTSDIEDLITRKVDAILLNAIDGKAVAPAVAEANRAGIPVIATARRVEGAEMTQFVACDNIKGGQLAAKIIAEKINGKGKVALIEGTPGSSSTTDRTTGFKQGIAQYPGITLVYQRPGNYKRDQALNLTEDLLQAHPDIAGIFYENDDMAIGGLQAIEAAGKLHKVVVVGYDGIKEGLENIKAGRLDATIYNDAISIAQISVDSAFKVIRGEKVDSYVSPPMPVITKDNVDQFLKIYQ